MEVSPQIIIDELLKKVNALTAENIILSAQVRTLTEKIAGYAAVSPGNVMSSTINSEGKYDEQIARNGFGSPSVDSESED